MAISNVWYFVKTNEMRKIAYTHSCEFKEKSVLLQYFAKNYVKSMHLAYPQCGKVVKNTITIFKEKLPFFRQINAFTKEITKELISRNILCVIAFYMYSSTFPHCAVSFSSNWRDSWLYVNLTKKIFRNMFANWISLFFFFFQEAKSALNLFTSIR